MFFQYLILQDFTLQSDLFKNCFFQSLYSSKCVLETWSFKIICLFKKRLLFKTCFLIICFFDRYLILQDYTFKFSSFQGLPFQNLYFTKFVSFKSCFSKSVSSELCVFETGRFKTCLFETRFFKICFFNTTSCKTRFFRTQYFKTHIFKIHFSSYSFLPYLILQDFTFQNLVFSRLQNLYFFKLVFWKLDSWKYVFSRLVSSKIVSSILQFAKFVFSILVFQNRSFSNLSFSIHTFLRFFILKLVSSILLLIIDKTCLFKTVFFFFRTCLSNLPCPKLVFWKTRLHKACCFKTWLIFHGRRRYYKTFPHALPLLQRKILITYSFIFQLAVNAIVHKFSE